MVFNYCDTDRLITYEFIIIATLFICDWTDREQDTSFLNKFIAEQKNTKNNKRG